MIILLNSQIPRRRGSSARNSGEQEGKHQVSQEAERGNCGQEPLLWFLREELGQAD